MGLMATLLLLMAVGFGLYRAKVIDDNFRKKFSWLLVSVAQCGLLLSSALNSPDTLRPGLIGEILLLSFAMHALLFAFGYAYAWLSRARRAERGTYAYMEVFGNLAFIGFPVVQVIFGDTAVVYAAIFCVAFNVLSYSVGIFMLAGRDGKVRLSVKTLVNPPLVASLLAAALMILKPAFPAFLVSSLTMLGNIYVPGGMLAIGAALACVPLRQAVGRWRVYVLAVLRLLLTPVLVHLLFGLFVTDPMLLGLTTVMAAMPVGINSTLLSSQYGGDESLTSSGVFLTTVFSVGTIPLICGLLLR